MQKTQKVIPKLAQKGTTNHPKTYKELISKFDAKKGARPG